MSSPCSRDVAVLSAREDEPVLRMLCSDIELDEDGEVLTVGDHVSRPVTRVAHVYYGTDLDATEWRFDQDAGASGEDVTTISGELVAISAVYVRMTATPRGGWTVRPGSAHLEPLDTTRSTRRIEYTVDWGPLSLPDEHDVAYRAGYPRMEEGDEHLSGWVFTLASPRFAVNAPAF